MHNCQTYRGLTKPGKKLRICRPSGLLRVELGTGKVIIPSTSVNFYPWTSSLWPRPASQSSRPLSRSFPCEGTPVHKVPSKSSSVSSDPRTRLLAEFPDVCSEIANRSRPSIVSSREFLIEIPPPFVPCSQLSLFVYRPRVSAQSTLTRAGQFSKTLFLQTERAMKTTTS